MLNEVKHHYRRSNPIERVYYYGEMLHCMYAR